jgi:hypothetical protein
MAEITQPYRRSLSGSVGAGLGSVFGGGKQYYILEHKMSSKYHRAGETQEIIVDEIEFGRDRRCQVRFDESFPTVSRHHAAIVREGDKWKLINLSEVNPTLLNGNKVAREWYLQNGDEIQLSVGGPRFGFIIPAAKTGSIGLTRRLNLFGQQALRPYKRAIVALCVALLLAIGGLTAWKLISDKEHEKQITEANTQIVEAKTQIGILESITDSIQAEETKRYENSLATGDSLRQALMNTQKDLLAANERNKKVQDDFNKRIKSLQSAQGKTTPGRVGSPALNNKAIEACFPYIYFVYAEKIETIFNGERKEIELWWSGTGFKLNDGRFVTARHIVEPWFFIQSPKDDMYKWNLFINNGGKIIVHYRAVSSSGDSFAFTNEQVVCNRSYDQSGVNDDGLKIIVSQNDNADWAYVNTGRNTGLVKDSQASRTLDRGVELTILGFPMGIGANSPSDINPIWGVAFTSARGLTRGIILTTNTTFEHGNSGGPVFYTSAQGKLIVIGIVSGGAGRSTGFIVPISSLF